MRFALAHIAVILSLGTTLPSSVWAAESPADVIQPQSSWHKPKLTFTVLERKGETFRARIDARGFEQKADRFDREVTGTVKGNKLSWRAKDVQAMYGGSGDDHVGVIDGDKIEFTGHDEKGGAEKFTLVRIPADGFETHIFHAPTGKAIAYKLLVPKGYDKTKHYPLVLELHGYGDAWTAKKGSLPALFLSPEAREKHPCLVVAPQAVGWVSVPDDGGFQKPLPMTKTPSKNVQLVLEVLDEVLKQYSVDSHRLYLLGQSNGACAVWDLLAREPKRWAAAMPMSGAGDPTQIAAAKGVPIWATHGVKDKTVPAERSKEMIAALQAAGGHPKFTEYPGLGHGDGIRKAYTEPDLLSWLFDQKLPKKPKK